MSATPGSLALDFDGVLCNGLKEYFQTAWRVYCQTWTVSSHTPPDGLAKRFYTLRPVVEVGWEMPVVLRAALQGFSDSDILSRWSDIRQQLVQTEDLKPQIIGQQVDETRDQWIQSDLDGWLDLHEFYPGIRNRLHALQKANVPFVIVTTKESRFVRRLLQRANIELEPSKIFGKDCKRPKPQTLRMLKSTLPHPIWFVEDRIAALKAVKDEPDLQDIQLFLADWGYNVNPDRIQAKQDPEMSCLSLDQFRGDFEAWNS